MTQTQLAPLLAPAHQLRLAAEPAPARPPLSVAVVAADPMTRAGIVALLRRMPDMALDDRPGQRPAVTVLVIDCLDDSAAQHVRERQLRSGAVVLVATRFDPRAVVPLLGFGVRAVLSRTELNSPRFVAAVRGAAAGCIELPASVVRQLVENSSRALGEWRPAEQAALTRRERDVLTLLASGLSTREIAAKLAYSERTIKNVLQELTTRWELRNRTHAVAYALRQGWI
jgi:DNA-binding NarL/FixJ family response regulator